jgi:phosphate transport system substrate-binding protein
MNRFLAFLLVIACVLHGGYSQSNDIRIIRVKGSDTMRILLDRLAEEYMKQHRGIIIFVEGGGSALGIRDLIRNRIDICTASRTIRPEEVRLLAKNFNRIGMNVRIAQDALSVYINPQNPLRDLSMKQLEDIFTGRIKNWSVVGGCDAPITVLIRSPNSGTFLFFKEHVLGGKNYSPTAKTKPTTMAIIKEVSKDINAIGYGGLAYGPNVIHCKINHITPSEQNVKNDRYPIIRYLYLYTIDTPRDHIKTFIDWILKDGQKIVREVGYIPLWSE